MATKQALDAERLRNDLHRAKLHFRAMTMNEVELRVGTDNKDMGFTQLFLYADARVFMDILDQTVGALGWQRLHPTAHTCVLSIYDKDFGQWVSKQDFGGGVGNADDKSAASDAFKRACVSFGLGRELYSCPKIFVKHRDLPEDKKGNASINGVKITKFVVENQKIKELEIEANNKKIYEFKA